MIRYIDHFPGRQITVADQKYLYFGGTSYLGLPNDPEFQAIFIDHIKTYGTGYGASRKSNVRFSVFDKAEAHLANLVGSEGCLTMSSGYLAAQLVTQHFNTPDHCLFYAPNTHAALHRSNTKGYATYASMDLAIRTHLENKKDSVPVVLMDSIDFSGSNYPHFDGLRSLPLEKTILIADDSHGIGILGLDGGGTFRQLKDLGAKELLVCSSLGKGPGIQAGAVFGTRSRIARLAGSAFFGGASPSTPAFMATLMDGQAIASKKRTLLARNVELFVSKLEHAERFLSMGDHPAFSFYDPLLATYLEEQHIILTNFNYPAENGDPMSRIVISAQHHEEDILKLVGLLNKYPVEELKII